MSRHRAPGWSRARCVLAGLLATSLIMIFAFAPGGGTYSAFSDHQDLTGNAASADVWQPNPPAACGAVLGYSKVVYLTGDGVTYRAGNQGEIVIGTSGDDTIYGGNGNDTIEGGNGKDVIDGGPGTDACSGGNAPDLVDCESVPPALQGAAVAGDHAQKPSVLRASLPSPTPTPSPAAAPPADSAASDVPTTDAPSPFASTTASPTAGNESSS